MKPVRVIAVDDSPLAREAYRLLLADESGFELVATAPNAKIARKKILDLDPDVIILDIEMPEEDGLSFLKWLNQNYPVPTVISSSYSESGAEKTMVAFSLGAVEVVCKGGMAGIDGWHDAFPEQLIEAIKGASTANNQMRFKQNKRLRKQPEATVFEKPPVQQKIEISYSFSGQCVVIGASTGGTETLARMIEQLPEDFPPTLIVQHMPPLYTNTFAKRLNTLGRVKVKEAVDGEEVRVGEVVVAQGGKQLRIVKGPRGPITKVSDEGPFNRHAPSVDILFNSAAESYRSRTVGILLTGMGRDGAQGLLNIKDNGGKTFAQSQMSCVVYGMPAAAAELGAAQHILDDKDIIPRLLSQFGSSNSLK